MVWSRQAGRSSTRLGRSRSAGACGGWLVGGAPSLMADLLAHGVEPAGWSLQHTIGPLAIGWVMQALVGAWSHLLPSGGPGGAARPAARARGAGPGAPP